MNENSWENVPEDVSTWFGFVYRIERINAKEGEKKYYWGCKMFFRNITRPPLKGKKRKRKDVKESDWKDYYGSSENLKADVIKYGKHNFRRIIIKLCSCKWQLKYEEMVEQIKNNVLFRDDTYNGIINVRIGVVPKNLKNEYKMLDSSIK
jgi:hypothetical protein